MPKCCVPGDVGKKGIKGWTGPADSIKGWTGPQGPTGPSVGGSVNNFRSHVWAGRNNLAPTLWPVLADPGPMTIILGEQMDLVGQVPQYNANGDITLTGGTDVMRMTIGTTGNYKISMGMILNIIHYGPFFADPADSADLHLILAKNLVDTSTFDNEVDALYVANPAGRNVAIHKESIISLSAGDTLTLVLHLDNYLVEPGGEFPGDGGIGFTSAFLNAQILP